MLLIGDHFAKLEHLMLVQQQFKLESGLWKSDVFVRDKQNVDAACRILDEKVITCLQNYKHENTAGTEIYLKMGQGLLSAYSEPTLSVYDRTRLVWRTVTFLRLWASWSKVEGKEHRAFFISDQTFTNTILAGHSFILSMLLFHTYFPDATFSSSTFGSDGCENIFSQLRYFVKGKNNFNMREMLEYAQRIQRLNEMKWKNKRVSSATSGLGVINAKTEILKGITDGEKKQSEHVTFLK